ncbi:TIM barrel protein [Acetomicrobium hydrogeniformans]|uniref:AP endonuclease, family 2 n=1 Tax=Acetomicrobium hydrogeniformans ATCC BAA-1850 TaxID=592015 RepID=A0A0T5XAW1_9BACT|nr:TIM barrel protein [Acetomicrobium hydrogeniformans]KRT35038.1 AP endonuclease, family 2 [Acetomicrobium hydrogeniformans ATCC BAA-1850]
MVIKVLCIETLFNDYPFEDRFYLTKKHGFDYVEFWSWADKDISRIKELCDVNNLKVAAFSGDQNYSLLDKSEQDNYIRFAKNSIEIAKYLNSNYLVLHSNPLDNNGNVLKTYDYIDNDNKILNIIDTLKALVPIAEDAGILLVLEPLNSIIDHLGNFLTHTEDSVKIIEAVGSPNIKILYDIYHMQIMEGNLINTIKKYVNMIGHIHIADVPGRHEPGTGEINYSNIFKCLNSINYSSTVGFELYPLYSTEKALNMIRTL